QKQIKELEARDRTGERIQNGALAAVALVLNVLVLLGGLRMRATRGYGLALAGSIAAIIPLNSCCCVGLPVGIWALVVLLKPEVKAAFQAGTGRGPREPADDLDPGFAR